MAVTVSNHLISSFKRSKTIVSLDKAALNGYVPKFTTPIPTVSRNGYQPETVLVQLIAVEAVGMRYLNESMTVAATQ